MSARTRIIAALPWSALLFCTLGCPPNRPDQTYRSPQKELDAAGLQESAQAVFGTFPQPSPAEPNMVALGQRLYFDTRLSPNQSSCNSCHDLARYGQDGLPTAPGLLRNTPTVLNASAQIAQSWDGRAASVEEQVELHLREDMGWENEAQLVEALAVYQPSFGQAFPEEQGEITRARIGQALGAYLRQLNTSAPFDRFLEGDQQALNPEQLRGLEAFMDAGCQQCHAQYLLGGQVYQRLGIRKDWPGLSDTGRAQVTGVEDDAFVFKVPGLRNVTQTGPYLHDGSATDLAALTRQMAEYQVGGALRDADVRAIVAFLDSLTGELPEQLTHAPSSLPYDPSSEPAAPDAE